MNVSEGVRRAARGPRRSRDALWRSAPAVLLRYPALVIVVLSGTALLAVAAAAAPMFLSATSSEIVTGSLERPHITRFMAGLTFRFDGLPLDPRSFGSYLRSPEIADLDAAFGEVAAGSPTLGAPLEEVLADPVELSSGGTTDTQSVRLFGAPDAERHVERVAGREGDGVWVPELIAKDLGVRPGDTIVLSNASRSVEITVDGIYADLYLALPPDGYWLQWEHDVRAPDPDDVAPPPQPLLADRDQALALARALGQRSATFSWQAPIADPHGLSFEDVQALDRYVSQTRSYGFMQSRLGQRLQCCGRGGTLIPNAETTMNSSIDAVVGDAERRIATVQGPAQVLEIAAITIALVVVAASGAFSVRARGTEAGWLFARGTAPSLVAAKSALEAFLPAVAGGVLGWAIAFAAVRTVGPGGWVDGSAYAAAGARAAVAVVVAVAVGSTVAGLAYLRMVDPHRRGLARIAGAVPWELGAIWLGYLAYRHLESGGALIADERLGVDRPSLALVAFPFLMLAGFAFLAARVALVAYRAIRPWMARAPAPLYLATRRLAAGGTLGVALIGAAGLCLGMFVHSQLVSRSLQATLDAKSHVYVGSDVAAQIAYGSAAPDDVPFPITRVVQVGQGVRLTSGRALDLLAIDPTTFAAAAYWNVGFADPSLDDLMRALHGPAPDGEVPILIAAGDGVDVREILLGSETVPVRVVGRVDAFPGLFSLRPLVVVDERALIERLRGPNPLARGWAELWARGDRRSVLDALAELEMPVYLALSATEVRDIPAFLATIGTFTLVNALGAVAAVLVLVSMVAYVRARQRSQFVAYALSTRMGLTHRDHHRALALELGSMIGTGLAAGTTLAILAAAVTVPILDPLPSIPPGPLFVVPLWAIVVTATAVAVVAWVGAGMVNRRARAANLDEVMRVAA
jgi:putative ABC transport system permease protein